MTYNELDQCLSSLGIEQEPCEYHGALCGMVTVGADTRADLGLGDNPGEMPEALKELKSHCVAMLEDPDYRFTPLLPDDERNLASRTHALTQWCTGYLYGLASAEGFALEVLSEDVQELIRDFTQISKAEVAPEDDETQEAAFAELVEYIRVGVLLIYLEFNTPRQPETGGHSLH